jgi:hypothetical protein
MIYTFIVDRCADLAVAACCRTMKVSRSAFHAWRHAQVNPTARMLADAELGDLVVKIHEQSYGTYGTRRVTAELRLGLGRVVNHKRVERLMRAGTPSPPAPGSRTCCSTGSKRSTTPPAATRPSATSVPSTSRNHGGMIPQPTCPSIGGHSRSLRLSAGGGRGGPVMRGRADEGDAVAVGQRVGVTGFDAADSVLVPMAFVAVILNVYDAPAVRPPILTEVLVAVTATEPTLVDP